MDGSGTCSVAYLDCGCMHALECDAGPLYGCVELAEEAEVLGGCGRVMVGHGVGRCGEVRCGEVCGGMAGAICRGGRGPERMWKD